MSLRKQKIFTVPHHKIQTYNLPTTIPKSYDEKQTIWKNIPMTFQQVTWVTIIIAVPNTNGSNNILCITVVMLFKYWLRDKRTIITHHNRNSPQHYTHGKLSLAWTSKWRTHNEFLQFEWFYHRSMCILSCG